MSSWLTSGRPPLYSPNCGDMRHLVPDSFGRCVGLCVNELWGDGRERTESVQQKSEADGQDFWTRLAQVIQDALNRRAGSVTTE